MEKTWKPMTAGILSIVGGCAGIGMASTVAWIPFVGLIAAPFIACGVVAIIGGIYALRRRIWVLALTGAILAIPLIPVGTVLGILATVWLSHSRKEFA